MKLSSDSQECLQSITFSKFSRDIDCYDSEQKNQHTHPRDRQPVPCHTGHPSADSYRTLPPSDSSPPRCHTGVPSCPRPPSPRRPSPGPKPAPSAACDTAASNGGDGAACYPHPTYQDPRRAQLPLENTQRGPAGRRVVYLSCIAAVVVVNRGNPAGVNMFILSSMHYTQKLL